jgi:DNA-binding NtrC family response regulator
MPAIIIVDDDRLVLHYLRIAVQRMGYKALVASNVADAEALCREHAIDLAIVDVMLDGQAAGPELLKRMQWMQPRMKGLLISGYSEYDLSREEGIVLGPGFMSKPFLLEMLRVRIREELAKAS